MRPITIGHIVNPVAVDEGSDLFVAQPITFETMRRARAAAEPELEISFFSAQYPEDRRAVPTDFIRTPDLQRSVRDLDAAPTKRKLPFVADICERLYRASDAEYLIFTNVDIAVKPTFYDGIADYLRQGYDAFALTRRNISSRFTSVAELPEMYAADGKSQRGPDCFVFHRRLYPVFELDDVFTGEPGIGRVVLVNLLRHGHKPGFFTDGALTFHIGNDGAWKRRDDGAGRANLQRSLAIVERLYHEANQDRRPLIRPHLQAIQRMLERGAPK